MRWLLSFIRGTVKAVTNKNYDYLDCVYYICLGFMVGRIDGIIEFVVMFAALTGFFLAFKLSVHWLHKKLRDTNVEST